MARKIGLWRGSIM